MYRAIFIALTALMITSLPDAHSAAPKSPEVHVQAQAGFHDTLLIPADTSEANAVVYTVPANKYLIIDDAGGDLRGNQTFLSSYPPGGALRVMFQTVQNQLNIEHFIGISPVFVGGAE